MADLDSPRILFIDAYDSYSNSIVGLIEKTLENAYVKVIHIDDGKSEDDLIELIRGFDGVVVGPGPGNPTNDDDVGIARFLWTLHDDDSIPVLGICLGFQSMAAAFDGARIARLQEARHGYVSNIIHNDSEIFEGVGELRAVQYHSLEVVFDHGREGFDFGDLRSKSMIQPLAYTEDSVNGNVLMGLKIRNKPFWGVQFHPESICTSDNASQLISNWWKLASKWLETRGKVRKTTSAVGNCATSKCSPATSTDDPLLPTIKRDFPDLFPAEGPVLDWCATSLADLSVTEVYEELSNYHEGVLLDSQGHRSGVCSIIGIVEPCDKTELRYDAVRSMITIRSSTKNAEFKVDSQAGFWNVIRKIMVANAIDSSNGPAESPFWGGLVGYISYEAGLDSLDILESAPTIDDIPEICFTWISRSIVVNHKTCQVFCLKLGSEKTNWPSSTCAQLEALAQSRQLRPSLNERCLDILVQDAIVEKPEREEYCDKVGLCKRLLAAGESYELCLTAQTRIYLPLPSDDSWDDSDWLLYKRLRAANPAPFGCFIKNDCVVVAGSSPERFLAFSRSGEIQFRPIKGTVKKGPGIDLKAATDILSSSKERAENLMIVDLIRHDLSGVIGSANCWVPKLMQVEEYETVYQLVSVIEGQLPGKEATTCESDRCPNSPVSAIDVLAAALPPGSMTGAPKKRSCELLSQLEEGPRGNYSGVLGYLDVGGGGDFSVVIRTAVKRRGEVVYRRPESGVPDAQIPHEVWRVGAGGAVTVQSTEIGEFEEMETKLSGVLRAFAAG